MISVRQTKGPKMLRISSIAALLTLTFTVAGCDSPAPKPSKPKTAQAAPKDKPDDKLGDEAGAPDANGKPPGSTAVVHVDEPGADGGDAEGAGGDPEAIDPELEGYDPRVARAATLAKNIEAKPEEADTVLALAHLDREALDALMYEIASDPDLTQQYRIARGI